MDRIRGLFTKKSDAQEYAPLADGRTDAESFQEGDSREEPVFSWLEDFIFALLGVAMLWAWNMFMAAAPYFQKRFEGDEWILNHFQSAITSVSTFINLGTMLVLANIQSSASYPFRINTALFLNVGIFGFLTVSTTYFLDVSAGAYLGFLLLMVALSAWATGLMQNGAFAFAASFGRPEYMQAIMAGQGVAGILPPLAQMMTVLAVPSAGAPSMDTPGTPGTPGGAAPPARPAGTAAFIYFLTAVVISFVALLAFQPLVRRHNHIIECRMAETLAESITSIEEAERAARKVVSIWTLLRKLRWLAGSAFMCFVVTMFFPVFTTKIRSVQPEAGRFFQPAAFIPLAFFCWNLGDLLGRVSTMLPLSLQHRPKALFTISLARWAFLPLYLLCNVGGRGAAVSSDLFYLVLVQFPFGLTNGWLGSSCMMAAGEWVDEGEREATGGFMGLCLVAGLTTGSLLSFSAAGI